MHFWNGNESKNPVLTSDFTKNAVGFFFFFLNFFEKMAKNHLFGIKKKTFL